MWALAKEFHRAGIGSEECATAVQRVTDANDSQAQIFDWKTRFADFAAADALERFLLFHAIARNFPKVEPLPVAASVKALFNKEFLTYTKPPGATKPPLLAGTDPFVTACKIATLRRFPAGPMDWVVSGVPRSWFLKMPPSSIPGVLNYLWREFGGLKPAFYVHIAPAPRNRSLVLKQEVRKAYYRMASSLELQPGMRGILCAGWFHDPTALRDWPHVEPLNEPYLHWGGRILAPVGPVPLDSGVLDYSPERKKLYESGQLNLHLTMAMWSRNAAVAWAAANRDLAA